MASFVFIGRSLCDFTIAFDTNLLLLESISWPDKILSTAQLKIRAIKSSSIMFGCAWEFSSHIDPLLQVHCSNRVLSKVSAQ